MTINLTLTHTVGLEEAQSVTDISAVDKDVLFFCLSHSQASALLRLSEMQQACGGRRAAIIPRLKSLLF